MAPRSSVASNDSADGNNLPAPPSHLGCLPRQDRPTLPLMARPHRGR